MPRLIRFVLLHGALGFGISAVFVALLMSTDTGGIAGLLRGAETHPLPALLLWFFCGLTFGSIQIGAAVMLLEDTDHTPRGGTGAPLLRPIPARTRRH